MSNQNNVISLENDFIEHLPTNINKKFIRAAFSVANSNCKTNEEKSYYFSRLNKVYQEKYCYVSVMSFISELFFLAMLNDRAKSSDRIVFAQNMKGDLQILNENNSSPIRIEVKAVMDDTFGIVYQEFLDTLRQIPSGRAYCIKFDVTFHGNTTQKEKLDHLNNIYEKILRTVKNREQLFEYGEDKITVEDLNKPINPNKTAFIGPVYSFIVDEEHLTKTLKRKITKDNKLKNQIKKTDIVAFHILDKKFDDEDVSESINKLQDKYGVEDKIFIYFTSWQHGEIKVHKYNPEEINPFTLLFIKNLEKVYKQIEL